MNIKKTYLSAIKWKGDNIAEIEAFAFTYNYDLRCVDEGRVDVVIDNEIVRTAFIDEYIVADGEYPIVCSEAYFLEVYDVFNEKT